MRDVTLVTSKRYFGFDAQQLRESTARVVSRLRDKPREHAVIPIDAFIEDFRVSAAASLPVIDEMVRRGLLQRVGERGIEYCITDKFRRMQEQAGGH